MSHYSSIKKRIDENKKVEDIMNIKKFISLSNEFGSKIDELKTELDLIKSNFTPESREHEYAKIESRLDHINNEMKMALRLVEKYFR